MIFHIWGHTARSRGKRETAWAWGSSFIEVEGRVGGVGFPEFTPY